MCDIRSTVEGFRGGLVLEVQRLCVSLNSRLESDNEEDSGGRSGVREQDLRKRLRDRRGNNLKRVKDSTRQSRPDYGLDGLICVIVARQRDNGQTGRI